MGKKNNNYYIFALYNALSTLYKCASQLTLGHQLYDPSAFEFLDGCSIAEFSLNPLSLTSYENAYRDCAAKKTYYIVTKLSRDQAEHCARE